MDLFEHYEEDFLDVKSSLEQKIQNIPNLIGVQRSEAVRGAEIELQDAEQTLRSMYLSARNVPNNSTLSQKCKEYENVIASMKQNLKKAEIKYSHQAERDDLFSGGLRDDVMMSGSMDQRQRLLSATDRLDKSSATLKNAMANAEETVQIGIEVMENLDRQKSTMHKMRDNLGQINDQIYRAKGLVRVMSRRVMTNKLILALIVLLLLGAIGVIVWLKWFWGSSDTPSNVSVSNS